MPQKNQKTGKYATLFGRGETWKALNRNAQFNHLNDRATDPTDPTRVKDSEKLQKLSLSKDYLDELNLLSTAVRITPMQTANWELLDLLEQALFRLSRSADILNASVPIIDEVIFPYMDYLLLRMQLRKVTSLLHNLETHLDTEAFDSHPWLSSGILYYKASIARHKGRYPLAGKYYKGAVECQEVNSRLTFIRLAKCYSGLALIQLLGNDDPGEDVNELLQQSYRFYARGYGGKNEAVVLAQLPLLDYYASKSQINEYTEGINEILSLRDWKKEADLFHTILQAKLARVFIWKSEYQRAEELLNESLHLTQKHLGPEHPVSIETLYYLSRTLIDLRKTHLAAVYLRSALQYSKVTFNRQHPSFYNIPGSLAKCYLQNHQAEKASLIITEKLDQLVNYKLAGIQDFNDAVTSLLEYFKEKGNYAEALPVIDKHLHCLEKRREQDTLIYSSILKHKIWALRRQKKFIAVKEIKHELASFHFMEEERKAANSRRYDYNSLAMKMKNEYYEYDLTEKYYKLALKNHPVYCTVLSNYGLFLVAVRKDYKAGKRCYAHALELNSKDPATLANYAFYLYTIERDFEKAETFFKEALEISPNYANYNNNLSGLRLVQGRMDEAVQLNAKTYDRYSLVNDQIRLRILFMRILLQMKQAEPYEEPLGLFRYFVEQGSIHSAWHNPVILEYCEKEFSGPELQLLENLYYSVSDEACLEELYKLPLWNQVESLDPMNYGSVPF